LNTLEPYRISNVGFVIYRVGDMAEEVVAAAVEAVEAVMVEVTLYILYIHKVK
jgi:hypothetical protein